MNKIKIFSVFVVILSMPFSVFSQNFDTDMKQAFEYFNKGKYIEAGVLTEKWLPAVKEVYGANDTSIYVNLLTRTGICFYYAGQYEKALPYFTEAKGIIQKVLGIKHPSFATTLSNLASLYESLGNYEAALPLFMEVKNIRQEVLGTKHPDYAASLNNLGSLYYKMGNYDAAVPLLEEAKNIRFKVLGSKSLEYAESLNNLAEIYRGLGNYKSALPMYEESLLIYKIVLGTEHPTYAMSLNNVAEYYRLMGNYDAALPLLEESMKIRKEVLGIKHPDYAASLNNLGLLNQNMGNYKTALSFLDEASTIFKEIYGTKHPVYAASLNNVAENYRLMGNYDAALPLFEESMSIKREVLGTKHPDYAMSLNNLALLYELMGKYETAIPLLVEAKSIIQETFGDKHSDYAKALNNLALLYFALGHYNKALNFFKEANIIIDQNIRDNFSFISESEKQKYLGIVSNKYEIYYSFLQKVFNAFPEFSGFGYNNELLLKGLILNSVTALHQNILESGDTSIIRQYEQMRMLKQQIIFLQQKPISERNVDMATLEQKGNELEKVLTRRSQIFGNLQASFKIKWEDVQKQLNDNEVAIEFISFDYYNGKHWTDSTLYCAMVLRKQDTYPQMVYLCEEKELKAACPKPGATYNSINQTYRGGTRAFKKITESETLTQGNLYKLLWTPLDSLLTGIKTVYFAPSGLLNSVSFAAIPCNDSTLLLDKYTLVQLSSTRTLALKQEQKPIKSAAVYGGIQYDTDTLTLLAKADKYHKEDDHLLAYNRSFSEGDETGFVYLPGTKKEAELITQKLNVNKINTTFFSGTDAIEESFLDLSGISAPSIIHFSTHGFYYPDTITNEKSREQIMMSAMGEDRFRYSDDPLQRSGLIMAGGNIAWSGQSVPAGVEDGILTAKEVSNMNLLNTQLVVLSACQTGLGDVKGSEGVEGLQRAFKMAGVRYITMSLWEVPDDETAEFMITFYDNLNSGKNIRDAFQLTQEKMRNIYRNEPYKWAAFVLME